MTPAFRNTPPAVRFWAKVEKTNDCWNWTGGRSFAVDVRARRDPGHTSPRQKVVYPHRFAYEELVGPLTRASWLRRQCGNPACVRPDHFKVYVTRGAGQAGPKVGS
jgi:hypothetical protein